MEPRANHVLIGAFTLFGAGLLLLFGLWSTQWASDQAWQHLEVHFLHPVSGLTEGSAVQYNGIRMGSVQALELSAVDPGRVVAVVRLNPEAPLRQDTSARLSVQGLTGAAIIQLRGGSADSPVLQAAGRGALPVLIAEESGLQRLMASSEDIASTASEVMLRLLNFLSEENADRVSTTLNNVDEFMRGLTGEGARLGEIMHNLQAGSAEFAPMLADARQVLAQLSNTLSELEPALARTLPEAAEEMSQAMHRLAEIAKRFDNMVARNEAAISGFGDEVLVPLGPAVDDLRRLLGDMSLLIERIDQNPAGFLFGSERPEEYRPR